MAGQPRQPWDAVYDQINYYRAPAFIPVPPATDSELDQVEAELGSPLPRSYRAFLKRFGPGSLELTFRLIPISPETQWGLTVVDNTREQRAYFSAQAALDARWPPNAEWLARVVYFGCNAGGEPYVWDPRELAESDRRECPVYCLRRHEEAHPELVAESFYECVRLVLERVRQWRAEEEPDDHFPEPDDLFPEDGFEPHYVRKKARPKKAEVRLWLARNNHAVRDLARSIRDGGQAEAFPVLADALQEAGCANADLLDSCRRGDPDIDGVWVLQMLLGDEKS